METRRLRYFVRIADAGSINRAAHEIGIAQPALSQQLAVLEAELGAKLFVRTHGGVTLTDAGMRLYARAHDVLRQIDRIAEEVGDAARAVEGRIAIGMPPTLAPTLGAGLIEGLVESHPRLRLHVAEAWSNVLVEQLRNGIIEMAVLPNLPPSADVETTPLFREPLLLATPMDMVPPLDDPARLAALPWIVNQLPNMMRAVTTAWFVARDCEPRVVAEVDSLGLLVRLIVRGTGVTIVPRSAVRVPEAEGRIRLWPLDPPIFRTVHLCTRSERSRSPAATAVEAKLRALAPDFGETDIGASYTP